MTLTEQIITISICAVGTMLTRFLPFICFKGKKAPPKYIDFLGKALPGAIFGMLVVYCLKGVNLTLPSYGLPELIAVLVVVLLHLWKRKMLLSIASGTVVYMLLVQFVF